MDQMYIVSRRTTWQEPWKNYSHGKNLNKIYWSHTANVNRQFADKLLFSYAIITGENVQIV